MYVTLNKLSGFWAMDWVSS